MRRVSRSGVWGDLVSIIAWAPCSRGLAIEAVWIRMHVWRTAKSFINPSLYLEFLGGSLI